MIRHNINGWRNLTKMTTNLSKQRGRDTLGARFKKALTRDFQLYLLCIPALIFIFIFEYGSMYGVQLAFKDFDFAKGIWGSEWVGFEHFERFLNSYQFRTLLLNTIGISLYMLIASFPIPIIMALVLNQIKNERYKKFIQTVTYAPHFISVVVLGGMIIVFLSPSVGIVNNLIASMGGERIHFMGVPEYWRHIFVWSDVWQNTGWNAIIYVAALAGINPELYEAAKVDGASKLRCIWHIDLPGIAPTMTILFIMKMGSIMNLGYQKALILQNSLNIDASEIISTYVYKIGLEQSQFSYSTAIGLFNTVVNIILLIVANAFAKKVGDSSLF